MIHMVGEHASKCDSKLRSAVSSCLLRRLPVRRDGETVDAAALGFKPFGIWGAEYHQFSADTRQRTCLHKVVTMRANDVAALSCSVRKDIDRPIGNCPAMGS